MNDSTAARKIRDMQKLSLHIDKLYESPKLLRLFWEATTRCNLMCNHCGSSCGADEPEDSLTADEMRAFLTQLAKDFSPREVRLCITGGEPLLREDLFDVMSHAADLGFLWGMTTNATLLTDEIVNKMIATNCKTISVSLDGLENSHNLLRGRDCYRQTVEGIKRLVAAKRFINVQITTVVHKQNIHELAELYPLYESLGVDSWRLVNIDPIGRANQMRDDYLSADDYRYMFEFIRSCRQRHTKMTVTYGCSHYVTPEYEMDIRKYFFICGAGIYTASILRGGDIFACLDIERKDELIQGNIRKDSFADVWMDGFSHFRRRREQLNADCAICPDAQYCRGDSAHTWDFDNNSPKCCLKQMFGL